MMSIGNGMGILEVCLPSPKVFWLVSLLVRLFQSTIPPLKISLHTFFWNQRLRLASKNSDFDSRFITVLMICIWLYNFIIIGSVLSFSKLGILVAFFLLLVKTISELNFYNSYMQFIGVKKGYFLILFGQLFHVTYMAILPIFSQLLSYKWKARVVK